MSSRPSREFGAAGNFDGHQHRKIETKCRVLVSRSSVEVISMRVVEKLTGLIFSLMQSRDAEWEKRETIKKHANE